MSANRARFIPDLLETHFEELEYLWGRRRAALTSALLTLRDFIDLNERVEAHIQGLLAVRAYLPKFLGQRLQEEGRDGVFAAACPLLRLSDADTTALLLDTFSTAQGPRLAGLRDAFGFAPAGLFAPNLRKVVMQGEPTHAVAAAGVLANQRLLDPAFFDHFHCLGVVGRFQYVHVQQPLAVGLLRDLEWCGFLGRNQVLAFQIFQALDLAVRAHQQACARDEMWDGEGHLLAALGIVGGRSALQISLALLDGRYAGDRGHQQHLDRHVLGTGLAAHGIGDLQTQVYRVALRLLVGTHVGKRYRRFALGNHQRAACGHLAQDALRLYCRLNRHQSQQDSDRPPCFSRHVRIPVKLTINSPGYCTRQGIAIA